MISVDALHIGPFMLPWTLLIVFSALIITSLCIGWASQKNAQFSVHQRLSRDLLWSSFIVGALGARVIFVLLNAEVYFVQPLDIFKIQDKGFHVWGGVIVATLWYWRRHTTLAAVYKSLVLAGCIGLIITGLLLKHTLQPKAQFPELALSSVSFQTNQPSSQIPLNRFIGQPTVINLWASWCPPCHREMPVLAQAAQQYPHIHVVMVNQGEDLATVQHYLAKHQFKFQHVLLDPNGDIPAHINSFGLPTTLFFNAQGQLIERHMGELSPAMLQHYLKKME